MTGAYAMGEPWLRWAQRYGVNPNDVKDWFGAMTGRRGHPGHHGRHGSPGFGQWAGFGPWGGGSAQWGGGGAQWGAGPPWAGGGRGPWRAPKARRGDVRSAILGVLAEQSLNGYQIIQEIASRSGGAWKPSPGSIYPTLQQLEDEGLVWAESEGGRRSYSLTDQGRAYVAEHETEVASPWEAMGEVGDDEFRPLIGQVISAVWQIVAMGTPEQQAKGREALKEFRRKLYAILAEDDATTEERT